MRSMTWSAEWPLRVNTTCTPSTSSSLFVLAAEWCASKTTVMSAPTTIPKTDRRSINLSRAASSDASPRSRLSSGQAWTTLYPSTIRRSIRGPSAEAHVRLAVNDEARIDAYEIRDVEHETEEGLADRRNEPERGKHSEDPELSVLDRETLSRVGQPRPDDAEPVQSRHRQQVQHQRHRLDESQKGKRREEVEVRLVDPRSMTGDDKRKRDEQPPQQSAHRPADRYRPL